MLRIVTCLVLQLASSCTNDDDDNGHTWLALL